MAGKAKRDPRTRSLAPPRLLHCAFCKKDQRQVSKLIAGADDGSGMIACICDQCVLVCVDVLLVEGHCELQLAPRGSHEHQDPDSESEEESSEENKPAPN